mmetsp:Transcript_9904/g.13487  ORF Transcript_9904/g.13487 Transcript_9904/m.13487 type:complete len:257 (-) Transcript_9904:1170-1940(-)
MEKIKTILDREPISSDYIASKQDFASVMNKAKGLSKPYWKMNLFKGVVGVTAVAIIVTAVTLTNSDDPVKKPNQQMAAGTVDSPQEESSQKEAVDQTEKIAESTLEKDKQNAVEETPVVETSEEPSPTVQETPKENTPPPTVVTRQKPVEEAAKPETIGLPNVAGVSGGPISFKDFCDPLGIQVGNGILIHRYTLQYRSCARDVTVRIAGNRLPRQLCEEIADCGSAIEVTFSNFKAEDRHGEPVKLQPFSLVTKP